MSCVLWRTVLAAAATLVPALASGHPLGNFSISHYSGLRLEPARVELRYVIDMAEIPTFQEIQDTGIVPEVGHPALDAYLARKAEALREGLRLEVDGRGLALERRSADVVFPPGAGGLPTLKLAVLYEARLDGRGAAGLHELGYRDANFPERAGWKEIVAIGGPGIAIELSSAPTTSRSRELADYPADLLESPPQDLEARVVFGLPGGALPTARPAPPPAVPRTRPAPAPPDAPPSTEPPAPLAPGRAATPRDAFTELLTTKRLGAGVVVVALAVAAVLGAAHALEPGHGKTVVAAYLVGSRGTAWHAFVLGLVVTASHTAGVYLLGALTLYASRYVVPERLYPWLGVASGLTIAGLGLVRFLRRYAGASHPHSHPHPHPHGEDAPEHHHPSPDGPVSLRELVALGITGGIVPCPGALVVLLSALALGRVGLGLLLIIAFSVGLAAVLVAVGLLTVYAGRLLARFQADGPLTTRWLPLTSSAVVTVLGLGIVVQALVAAGVVQIRLG